jgi:hypothetical protein
MSITSDSAKGPIAGFLFQFEKALVQLATLENSNDMVSIELVDDVAVLNEKGVILISIQAKNSISSTGTTFEDTSYALWRTLQIWIEKLEKGIFNSETQFVCSTNKKIKEQSLVKKIQTGTLTDVLVDINELLNEQRQKLSALLEENPKAGSSIKKTIKLIEFVLSKPREFEIIKNKVVVSDQETPIEKFLVAVHMSTDLYTEVRKTLTFESMYGWLTSSSKAKWQNSTDAIFSKRDFDTKLAHINSNPSIMNAVFRKKDSLGSVDSEKFFETKKELFVTQIEDIDRNLQAKKRKIETAVHDFIYHDIEMSHIIKEGYFTESDFDEFKNSCRDKWQLCYDEYVTKELEDYNDQAKNELAIRIFDSIMDKIEVCFQDGISFTSSNRYLHNGTFLKLSNVSDIGWHPEWETKYKK